MEVQIVNTWLSSNNPEMDLNKLNSKAQEMNKLRNSTYNTSDSIDSYDLLRAAYKLNYKVPKFPYEVDPCPLMRMDHLNLTPGARAGLSSYVRAYRRLLRKYNVPNVEDYVDYVKTSIDLVCQDIPGGNFIDLIGQLKNLSENQK